MQFVLCIAIGALFPWGLELFVFPSWRMLFAYNIAQVLLSSMILTIEGAQSPETYPYYWLIGGGTATFGTKLPDV